MARMNTCYPDRRLDPMDYEVPACPCCGEECETHYKKDGEIIGCENCIDKTDAYENMDDEDPFLDSYVHELRKRGAEFLYD